MSHIILKRIDALRLLMKEKGVDAVIVPQADPHKSEYLADHWQLRRFLSGFSGSAGTLVVTSEKAALWTDSRYFLQAERQLEGTGIQLMKEGLDGVPTIDDWLFDNLKPGNTLAIDGWLFFVDEVDNLLDTIDLRDVNLVEDSQLVSSLWTDRPPLPDCKAFIHEEKYAGQSAGSKIQDILDWLESQYTDAYLVSALDEIAWILNLRGADVRCNPVNIAYLYISANKSVLFIEPKKVEGEVAEYLTQNNVEVMPYDKLEDFVRSLPNELSVLADRSTMSYSLYQAFAKGNIRLCKSPVTELKAVKNTVQQEGFRHAMRRDGVALVYGFKEIEERLARGEKTTEIDVADILLKYRSRQPLFHEESFETISGYGPHGAIVHYSATPDTDTELKPEGLLLVDSGAQYQDGTTDITRTIALGTPTPQEKRDFTLVLKGMIALARAVFPRGTRGIQLDILAHQFLWRAGQQYLHGTGHGVGHFLNVHEGPVQIRSNNRNWNEELKPGMVLSDEPGLYKAGVHGIRCENLLLVHETVIPGADDFQYLDFETLTLFPFDLKLVDKEIMMPDEIEWLNSYHQRVYDELSPLLDESAKEWLVEKTRSI